MAFTDDRKRSRRSEELVTLDASFFVQQAAEAIETFVSPVRVIMTTVAVRSDPRKGKQTVEFRKAGAAGRKAIRKRVQKGSKKPTGD